MATRDRIEITIDDRLLRRKVDRFIKDMPRQADTATDQSAQQLASLIRDDVLNRLGSGEATNVSHVEGAEGSVHYPSIPGEPPSPITSNYRNSWSSRRIANALHRVSTGQERGVWLEFGTRTMQPRPHVAPAVRQHIPDHIDIMQAAIAAHHN